jgi:hypothetical protein
MATLNRQIAVALDATQPFEYEIPNTGNLRNFTVEAEFTGLSYPAAENDAELLLQDGELNDKNGTVTVSYETVKGGLVKAADLSQRVKIRIVDLTTKNAKVKWNPNSANAGTIDVINISFSD